MRAFLVVVAALVLARPAAAETIRIEFTGEPYRQPYAFLGLTFEGVGTSRVTHGASPAVDGRPLSLGLRMMSARDTNLQLEIGLGLGKLDASALKVSGAESLFMFEMTLGGRLFPRTPLVTLGSVAIRPTLSASGGFNTVGGGANGVAILTGGFAFGISDDPNGLTAEFVYRPLGGESTFTPEGLTALEDKITYGSFWGLRFGFLFGP